MPTLTDYIAAAGSALNDYARYQVGTSTTTTTQISFLSTSDASVSANKYDDTWLYVASGSGLGQMTKIKKGSYVPATGQVGFSLAIASLVSGNFVDLTSLFPIVQGPLKSDANYRALINAALKRVNVMREITVPITTANRLALNGYPWLDVPERLLSVSEPSPSGTTVVDASWRRPELIPVGSNSVIELKAPFYAASGNLTLRVIAPGDSYIGISGVYAESSVGLVSQTDAALPSTDVVTKAFLVEAYRVLMHRSPARPNGNWAELYEAQLKICREEIAFYDFERPMSAQATAAPMVAA